MNSRLNMIRSFSTELGLGFVYIQRTDVDLSSPSVSIESCNVSHLSSSHTQVLPSPGSEGGGDNCGKQLSLRRWKWNPTRCQGPAGRSQVSPSVQLLWDGCFGCHFVKWADKHKRLCAGTPPWLLRLVRWSWRSLRITPTPGTGSSCKTLPLIQLFEQKEHGLVLLLPLTLPSLAPSSRPLLSLQRLGYSHAPQPALHRPPALPSRDHGLGHGCDGATGDRIR